MEDLLEKLAANEHERWAHWQKFLHKSCLENEDGSLTIPKEKVELWKKQINTPYEELTENEKESDRYGARKILEILKDNKYE